MVGYKRFLFFFNDDLRWNYPKIMKQKAEKYQMSKKEKLQTAHLISHCHMKKFTTWFFFLSILLGLTNHDI